MARTRTLTLLRDEVRQRADLEDSDLVSNAELTRYINQSICALYDEIVDEFEGDFVTSATQNTAAGTTDYTIHASFYRLATIPPRISIGGVWRQLERWQPSDETALRNAALSGWGSYTSTVYYRLKSTDQIQILPAPDGVYSLVVFYVPAPTDLSADGDTFDGRNGWEEWVVMDSAIKCLIKEEGDVSALVNERNAKLASLKARMRHKDPAGPRRVVDVERGDRYWPWE